jgi:DNA-binding MarR family transcriptional regulator
VETLLTPHEYREQSEAREVAAALLEVVPLAMRQLRKELRIGSDLSIAQFRILAHLGCEPANNKTLAEALGVSVPATSRMVKLLVQRKYVESTQGVADKREVLVKLTKSGERRFEIVRNTVREGLALRLMSVAPSRLRKGESGLRVMKGILAELHSANDCQGN